MARYAGKFCSKCNKLAFKCSCGELPTAPRGSRTRPFMRPTAAQPAAPAQAPAPTPKAEVPAPQSPVALELAKVTLDQIPGEPPADNKGGRLNVYVKARREVYEFFIRKLNSSLQS